MDSLEAIAGKSEVCSKNQDWKNKKYTDIKNIFLVPRKDELDYCSMCNDNITVQGEKYCLVSINNNGKNPE